MSEWLGVRKPIKQEFPHMLGGDMRARPSWQGRTPLLRQRSLTLFRVRSRLGCYPARFMA